MWRHHNVKTTRSVTGQLCLLVCSPTRFWSHWRLSVVKKALSMWLFNNTHLAKPCLLQTFCSEIPALCRKEWTRTQQLHNNGLLFSKETRWTFPLLLCITKYMKECEQNYCVHCTWSTILHYIYIYYILYCTLHLQHNCLLLQWCYKRVKLNVEI